MFIRLMGQFQVQDIMGQDFTPRGAKARAILALLCQTPGHCRPRRWLETRLWSDRGQEQASGSLRQALTELRKTLGPLAVHLKSDRDCVSLTGFVTDLDQDPEGARVALAHGREFLEGIDIIDAAFCAWLAEERERLAQKYGQGEGSPRPRSGSQPFTLRLGSLPEGTEAGIAQELAGAIARLAAEYLLRDGAGEPVPEGLDLQIEGAWSEDRAHLKLRLVAQSDQKTIWTQRLIATRKGDDPTGAVPALVFETSDAPIM
ncbi:hypothetical protein [Rhodobacter sp. SY28-1]|uniref:AfsR/SARP family transcriptional regulator n=1 Tax=Rhodobacter sp. SY28-1 TaxID=2562317 RepID=UPI0010BF74CF|nr:hypothetical protein [Rhodobacter sp. SY28-1]